MRSRKNLSIENLESRELFTVAPGVEQLLPEVEPVVATAPASVTEEIAPPTYHDTKWRPLGVTQAGREDSMMVVARHGQRPAGITMTDLIITSVYGQARPNGVSMQDFNFLKAPGPNGVSMQDFNFLRSQVADDSVRSISSYQTGGSASYLQATEEATLSLAAVDEAIASVITHELGHCLG